QSVDNTSVLIRYTLYGDANLDGVVNALDFNAVANNFGTGGKFWSQGDFNYDGTVNTLDFTALAGNFGSALLADAPLGSLVPEPQTFATMSLLTVFSRRQRRSRLQRA